MRTSTKIGIGATVLGLVLSTAPAGAVPHGAAEAALRATASGLRTVTLLTGDRITVGHSGSRSVTPAKGREGTAFHAYRADGHDYVIPADAGRLVASGLVDRRLFDVTTLLEFGYDDAHRDSVPIIVSHPDGQARAARVANATVTRELPSIDAVALSVRHDDATAVWEALTDGDAARTTAEGVSRVWLDGRRRATLEHSVPQIGAPTAWAAGYTGDGVRIAVLDSGVDQTHADLADREVAEANFSSAPDSVDRFGHGTHVASAVAGTGARSGGRYRGVAPGAAILDGKVLDDNGYGTDSQVVAGMEWAAEQGADVVNMSLGGDDTPGVDPLEQAVDTLSARHGTLFVISAGNAGPSAGTVGSPGSAAAALTVGAVDRTDALADFSSRGPTVGAGAIKPDVTAPGVDIVAALHTAGTINPPVVDGYTALSGTSMAAPHVAGAAALLAQRHPDWTGDRLKGVLAGSATPTPGSTPFEQGSGRIDVAAALERTLVSEPVNVSLGSQRWDDREPVASTLTYRNLGDRDLALALSVEATGPDGQPADVFSLSTRQLTVPAGGTAEVTVTGDTGGGDTGVYGGAVVAREGESVTRTPVAVLREPESYDITFRFLDEHGRPTGDYVPVLMGLDESYTEFPYDADGTLEVRVPKGRYLADHVMYTHGGTRVNHVVAPGIVADRDRSYTVDARATKPVAVTPPEPARLLLADVGYWIESPVTLFTSSMLVGDLNALRTAQLGTPVGGDRLTGKLNTQWQTESGSFYGLSWYSPAMPGDVSKVVRRRDLATVRAEFGATTEGHVGLRTVFPHPAAGVGGSMWTVDTEVSLPGARTEYYTTEGVRWHGMVAQYGPTGVNYASWIAAPRTYRPGRTYDARFLGAVYGPGAAQTGGVEPAVRRGDDLSLSLPLFTDRHGNSGFSVVDRASTRLYRDGTLVGAEPTPGWAYFEDLPPTPSEYRLTVEAVRPAEFAVSSAVSATWTFRSAHVPDGGSPLLPVRFVRYGPGLDADDSARAGRAQLVLVQVQDQRGVWLAPRTLSVEVSYDEGRTWRRAPVLLKAAALLTHPRDATSVSLRAKAADRDGNTVEQTVLRAYLLR